MKKLELWKITNTDVTANTFSNLYERWQDEKEYEDINDYLLAIQKTIPQAYKILKRPFSVICKCDDGNLQIGIKTKGQYLQLFAKDY